MNNRDEEYIELAYTLAKNSRAVRLKVGAIIVNKDGMIISVGINGTPDGMDDVCEKLCCEGTGCESEISSVEKAQMLWDKMQSSEAYRNAFTLVTKPDVVHAELNAILECASSNGGTDGATLYVTDSPCYSCALAIIQCGIRRVVYSREYRIKDGIELLKKAGVEVKRIEL